MCLSLAAIAAIAAIAVLVVQPASARAPAARKSSVQTASLQCFRVISKGCIFILIQITEKKVIELQLMLFCTVF